MPSAKALQNAAWRAAREVKASARGFSPRPHLSSPEARAFAALSGGPCWWQHDTPEARLRALLEKLRYQSRPR